MITSSLLDSAGRTARIEATALTQAAQRQAERNRAARETAVKLAIKQQRSAQRHARARFNRVVQGLTALAELFHTPQFEELRHTRGGVLSLWSYDHSTGGLPDASKWHYAAGIEFKDQGIAIYNEVFNGEERERDDEDSMRIELSYETLSDWHKMRNLRQVIAYSKPIDWHDEHVQHFDRCGKLVEEFGADAIMFQILYDCADPVELEKRVRHALDLHH